MAQNVSLTVAVSGEVQGVFFRDFIKHEARNLGVVGEVMNKEDGTVSIYAEGTQEKLDVFLQRVKTGSPQAVVQEVLSEWGESINTYTDFIIRYS